MEKEIFFRNTAHRNYVLDRLGFYELEIRERSVVVKEELLSHYVDKDIFTHLIGRIKRIKARY